MPTSKATQTRPDEELARVPQPGQRPAPRVLPAVRGEVDDAPASGRHVVRGY
ncbi:MAG: hypothetical protein ACREQ5_15645 [Candidatus Dormibacteria bacterium]